MNNISCSLLQAWVSRKLILQSLGSCKQMVSLLGVYLWAANFLGGGGREMRYCKWFLSSVYLSPYIILELLGNC